MANTFDDEIKNWRKVYPTELAKHFKKHEGDAEQFERLAFMRLEEDAIEALFPANMLPTEIDFAIMLGLDCIDSPSNKFTFRPIIEAKRGGSIVTREFSHVVDKNSDPVFNEPVPETFKKWLTSNWMSYDINLLGNAFTGSFLQEAGTGSNRFSYENKRLQGYYFNADTNKNFWTFINANRGSIREFIFHLGLDMNKFNHIDMFTFSPVFEVHVSKSDNNIIETSKLGLRTFHNNDEIVTYYEYSAPCPPTCP